MFQAVLITSQGYLSPFFVEGDLLLTYSTSASESLVAAWHRVMIAPNLLSHSPGLFRTLRLLLQDCSAMTYLVVLKIRGA